MKFGHTIDDSKAKYPELTDEILDELRAWSDENTMPRIPDEQLAIFAHSCYYDVEATKSCMTVYYRLRATVPAFFHNRDPSSDSNQLWMKRLNSLILPVPDENGNRIIFHRMVETRPSAYSFNDGVKLLFMSMDANLYNEGCTPGYVVLFDMNGAKLGHLMKLSVESIRRAFEYLQEGFPVRLKAIHVFNTVWFIDKIMLLLRPFMNRELVEMLHFYNGDASAISEHVPPKCLPKDYGGELETFASLYEKHCTFLVELRDYFIEEESLFRGWSSDKIDEKKSSNASSNSEFEDNEENRTVNGDTRTIK